MGYWDVISPWILMEFDSLTDYQEALQQLRSMRLTERRFACIYIYVNQPTTLCVTSTDRRINGAFVDIAPP